MPIPKSHISKDSVTPFAAKDLEYTDLAADTIQLTIPFTLIYERAELPANAVGVVYEGPHFRTTTELVKHIKGAVIRGSWDASHTDSRTTLELYDLDAAEVLASMSGNYGEHVEVEVDPLALTGGNTIEGDVNVTTKSATSTATTKCLYLVLEITLGVR